MSREVYIPVSITLEDDGSRVISALAGDYSAPWMYVDSEPNVYGPTEDGDFDWSTDEDLTVAAIEWLDKLFELFSLNPNDTKP